MTNVNLMFENVNFCVFGQSIPKDKRYESTDDFNFCRVKL